MRSPFLSRTSFILFAICLAAALSQPLSAQEERPNAHPVPSFQDWSTHHLVFTSFGDMRAIQQVSHDPRAMFGWRRRVPLFPVHGLQPSHRDPRRRTGLERDWSINLGVNGTAPAMYPAKFSFDVTAAPSCTADFVVFPINAPGGSGQPNIVGFDHLYSGTAGGNGICNRTPVAGVDVGTSAEVAWSYNVRGILGGGAVATSPVLSFDLAGTTPNGAKVAFVESSSGGQILTATVTPGHGGNNYAVGDTGTITGGSGALATYQVTTITSPPRGPVTGVSITYPGTGYAAGAGLSTARTSGVGNGNLQLTITVSASSAAHFHVLAWKTGDGRAANLQNVLAPLTISTFSLTAPAPGSGTATDLVLGASGTDTLSSPFVDYSRDVAYVGNDIGVLYRIKDVFCTGNNPDCSGPVQPAPSLDATWGTGGAVTIGGTCTGANGKLTGPVLDFVTLNVYVGCADGKLYQVSQAGTVVLLTVGDSRSARAHGGIVDPPIVDGVNGFVYAVSGSANNATSGVLVQAKVGLASSVAVPIGAGNQCDLHDPALNNVYFTSPTAAGALIYMAGVTGAVGPCTATGATGGNLAYYGVTFGAGGVMTSGAPANAAGVGMPGNEFAPLTEFFNANLGEDLIFFSVLTTDFDMASLNITAGFPGSNFAGGPVHEGFGTSGIVIDNQSASNQASSIYFNSLGENATCNRNTGPASTPSTGGCAVKLTQSALQ